jgi:hypothetical protein
MAFRLDTRVWGIEAATCSMLYAALQGVNHSATINHRLHHLESWEAEIEDVSLPMLAKLDQLFDICPTDVVIGEDVILAAPVPTWYERRNSAPRKPEAARAMERRGRQNRERRHRP